MSEKKGGGMGGGLYIFVLPMVVVSILSVIAAFAAAKIGAARPIVRLILFPLNFLIANFAGLLPFAAVTMCIGMFTRSPLYVSPGAYLDLTFFNVWGRFIFWLFNVDVAPGAFALSVPIWHIILFQVIVWLLIGNGVARATTSLTMAAAGR